jgi:hypothetical protein
MKEIKKQKLVKIDKNKVAYKRNKGKVEIK